MSHGIVNRPPKKMNRPVINGFIFPDWPPAILIRIAAPPGVNHGAHADAKFAYKTTVAEEIFYGRPSGLRLRRGSVHDVYEVAFVGQLVWHFADDVVHPVHEENAARD